MESRVLGRLAIGGLVAAAAGSASAQDVSNVKISAFGQVAFGLLLNGDTAKETNWTLSPTTGAPVATTSSVPTTSYQGYDKGTSWDRDTRFGFNISGDLTNKISFSLGIIAQRYKLESATDRGATWPLAATLAALRFEPGYNVSLSIGRLPAPFWLISEEKYVGITYPWITPPLEVYNLVSGSENLEGARLSYTANIGDLTIRPSVFAGNFPGFDPISTANFHGGGGTLDLEYNWLNLHAMFCAVRGAADISYNTTQSVPLSATQPINVVVPNAFSVTFDSTFENFGIRATPGHFLFMGEYATTAVRHITGTGEASGFTGSNVDRSAYYATAGYWIGIVLPRVTYSVLTAKDDNLGNSTLSKSLTQAPYSVQQGVEATAFRGFNFANQSQSWNLGVNVQLDPKVVLKIEYQQSRATSDTYDGLFSLAPQATARIAQAAVDFAI